MWQMQPLANHWLQVNHLLANFHVAPHCGRGCCFRTLAADAGFLAAVLLHETATL